jgi:hypothetical protein
VKAPKKMIKRGEVVFVHIKKTFLTFRPNSSKKLKRYLVCSVHWESLRQEISPCYLRGKIRIRRREEKKYQVKKEKDKGTGNKKLK